MARNNEPGAGCLLRGGRNEEAKEPGAWFHPFLHPEPRIQGRQIQGRDGDKFWRMPECYIRGSTIKYLRIPDEIIDMVKEEVVSKGRGRGGMQQQKQQKGRGVGGAGRGVFGGRGRGIPGSGRGQQEKKPGRQSAKQ
ncbi:U6 snRNA-associated Sm-like protein LSm4 isoform X2 [Chiroxiphia lanceolata]|uniref:U6 snRNA-associated Sm-like protein LSm4 isoform X2 n=1 Tax=Lepidothrix coronata TaxID=321398 RepID=A0A6J0J8C5_9PASS|nr:PREDICTED: U6 snRNA-associated Sm-like protein LSm4 isoform X2 [Lepidothrix coronata]XP_027520155.1 U6 snRNA-associated Sm-like protein LSm4 isoform X1 [Corapipo altera]XP_032567721.1 U6 snRNA-associated Sm-like protein LSm4 isoform X2 [Chiroxiphia lanceolata]